MTASALLCPHRYHPRAFNRVNRDIDFWPIAFAHLFANPQHRRMVNFSFADNHSSTKSDVV